ncbi:MAG: RidA family protein [Acidimicrobiia bacterium]
MRNNHNPEGVAGPFASYSHGVELDGSYRFLFGAGQAGVSADGSIGEGIAEQAAHVWSNIRQVLASADMAISDIVQLNMLLIDRGDYPEAAAIRESNLDGHRPASTLMYVSGLANPDWRIEIDFIAACPDVEDAG